MPVSLFLYEAQEPAVAVTSQGAQVGKQFMPALGGAGCGTGVFLQHRGSLVPRLLKSFCHVCGARSHPDGPRDGESGAVPGVAAAPAEGPGGRDRSA